MPAERAGKYSSSRDPDYEARIQAAVQSLSDGTYTTIAQAAREHNVVRQTLQDRVSGKHRSRQEATTSQQLLNPEQENALREWCDHVALSGQPLSRAILADRVYTISGKHPGAEWHKRWERRHGLEGVYSGHPKKTESPQQEPGVGDQSAAEDVSQLQPHTPSTSTSEVPPALSCEYFTRRRAVSQKFGGIPPENDWYMDEVYVHMDGGRSHDRSTLYFTRNRHKRSVILRKDVTRATVVECFSGTGATVLPGITLTSGESVNVRGVAGQVGVVAMSNRGWNDHELNERWFEESFVPIANATRDPDRRKPVIVTLDGHDTRHTCAMQRLAYEHNIIVFCLSPKDAPALQALCDAVFQPVKETWEKHCEQRLQEGVKIVRENFIEEYTVGARKVLTKDLIRHALHTTGLLALNDAPIANVQDTNPSQGTSSVASHPTERMELDSVPNTRTEVEEHVIERIEPNVNELEYGPSTSSTSPVLAAADTSTVSSSRRTVQGYTLRQRLPPPPANDTPPTDIRSRAILFSQAQTNRHAISLDDDSKRTLPEIMMELRMLRHQNATLLSQLAAARAQLAVAGLLREDNEASTA